MNRPRSSTWGAAMVRALTRYAAYYTLLYAVVAIGLMATLFAYGFVPAILYTVAVVMGGLILFALAPRSPRVEREGGK